MERKPRLQAQAVARAEPGEFEPVGRAGGEQRLGQRRGVGRGMVKLEAVLAGVAGAADQALHARHRALAKRVVRQQPEFRAGEGLHDGRAGRSLDGKESVVGAAVGYGHVEALRLPGHPGEVGGDVAGVDAEQVNPRRAQVDQQVVERAAVLGAHRAVEHLAGVQAGDLVGHKALQKLQRLRPFHVYLAHVADVEEPGRPAHRLVLLQDGAVLDRHFPPGEVHQPAAAGGVEIAKRGALQVAHERRTAGGRAGPPGNKKGTRKGALKSSRSNGAQFRMR